MTPACANCCGPLGWRIRAADRCAGPRRLSSPASGVVSEHYPSARRARLLELDPATRELGGKLGHLKLKRKNTCWPSLNLASQPLTGETLSCLT